MSIRWERDVTDYISLAVAQCESREVLAAEVGVSPSTVRRWSKGQSYPARENWRPFEKATGMPAGILSGFDQLLRLGRDAESLVTRLAVCVEHGHLQDVETAEAVRIEHDLLFQLTQHVAAADRVLIAGYIQRGLAIVEAVPAADLLDQTGGGELVEVDLHGRHSATLVRAAIDLLGSNARYLAAQLPTQDEIMRSIAATGDNTIQVSSGVISALTWLELPDVPYALHYVLFLAIHSAIRWAARAQCD